MGVKNLLRQEFDVDLIGETNIQGREFTEYYINEVVNKKYDLLVIGGGGIIHGSHWPNGWFWLINKNLIKSIKVPFVVYGVGNNYFDCETIPQKAIEHLEETNKYSSYFSVRNDESYERLTKQLAFLPYEIPDPGFHVGLNTKFERPIEGPYVVIQLANDKPKQRFNDSSKQKFINGLREVIKNITKTRKVIFLPHVLEDVLISELVAEGIDNAEVLSFGNFAFDHSDKMIAYYKYADFVLAMRGHGQIIPISFNVPVIALQNHPKHVGLMRKLQIEKYNVDVNAERFQVELKAAVDALLQDRVKIINHYKQLNEKFAEQSAQAMKDIRRRVYE